MFASRGVLALMPGHVYARWAGVCMEWKNWGMDDKNRAVVGGWSQSPTPTARLDAVSDSRVRVCRPRFNAAPPRGHHFNQLQCLFPPSTDAEPHFALFDACLDEHPHI